MTDHSSNKDFHSEIDDAIDNLFTPFAGTGAPPTSPQSPNAPPAASRPATPPASSPPPSAHEAPKDGFAAMEEALLSLDWEISGANIGRARAALQSIRESRTGESPASLTELFSLMDTLLEAMASAPQSLPTSAPKLLREGLRALQAAATTDNIAVLEQTMIDPTLSELRSIAPSAGPIDYTKLLKPASAAPARPIPPPPPSQKEEEPTLPLPPPCHEPRTELLGVVNNHLAVLNKCIAKRIVPLENLFAKSPGYEKLHAIVSEVRERLEEQQQSLIGALGTDHCPDIVLVEQTTAQRPRPSSFPWDQIAVATWKGTRVGFVPEQIAYDGAPANRKDGAFFPLKCLRKGFFGKIKPHLSGELAKHEEPTLKALRVPVAMPPNGRGLPQADDHLIVVCKENCCLAFWTETSSEQITVDAGASWVPGETADSLFAGTLTIGDQTLPIVAVRGTRA